MLTVHVAEQRNGRIKFSTDVDCLPPDAIRVEKRILVDLNHLKAIAATLEDRGFIVCVDTETYFHETNWE